MGWEQDRHERSFNDYGADKRYGETYNEAFNRQSNERAARHEDFEKSMNKKWAKSSRNTLSAEDFYGGKTERTFMAKIAGNIGIGLLAIAAICYVAGVSYSPFEGSTLAGLALKVGIGFVVLGYFAHVLAVFTFLVMCLSLITQAFTPDGFSLGAIPASSWGGAILLILIVLVISQVFGRK